MKTPSEKWLNKTVTLSRDEFSTIIAHETKKIIALATIVNPDLADTLKELIFMFAAMVGTEMFGNGDLDDLEVEE